MHRLKQHTDSRATRSPSPPQHQVRRSLQHRVSFETRSTIGSSKYTTFTRSCARQTHGSQPQHQPSLVTISGRFHSMEFSRSMTYFDASISLRMYSGKSQQGRAAQQGHIAGAEQHSQIPPLCCPGSTLFTIWIALC